MKIIRSLRLVSGLVLFAFVIMHLINHAFGLASIETMEQARKVLMLPWANAVGGIVILICMVIHMSLGLFALYQRSTLRLNLFDSFQLLLGLCIPFLLLPHLVVMLIAPLLLNERMPYSDVLTAYWSNDPWLGLRMVLGVMAVWIHGCMGLFTWMQVQSWWQRVAPAAYPIIVLVPVLALLGFVEAGKEVIGTQTESDGSDYGYDSAYSSDRATSSKSSSDSYASDVDTADTGAYSEEFFLQLINTVMLTFIVLLGLVLLARYLRIRGITEQVTVQYATGRSATAPVGVSLLEVSRFNNVSHGSLCGGKGRCGTCQVRILEGQHLLPPRNDIERDLLARLNAADDVRLACQTVPAAGKIALQRLISRPASAHDARALARGDADRLLDTGVDQEATT